MKIIASTRGALLIAIGLLHASACSDTQDDGQAPAHEQVPPEPKPAAANELEEAAQEPAPSPMSQQSPAEEVAQARAFSLLRGKVTDLGEGKPQLGLGGQGTLASATKVRASTLETNGALKLVAEAELDVVGDFELSVPTGLTSLLVETLDATGHVLGSVVVAASASVEGELVLAAPITTETSIEARVLQEAKKCACQKPNAPALPLLSLDVAALIDAQVSAAVAATAKLGIDLDILVNGLAEAAVTASQARLDALLQAGVKLDLSLLAQAEIDALAELGLGLHGALTGKLNALELSAQLAASLDAALSAAGALSADVRVRSHVASTLSFSSALSTSLAGVVHVEALLFTALKAAVKLQSQVAVTAIVDVLAAAGVKQVALDAALNAGAKLLLDIDAAASIEALVKARIDFVKVLCGNGKSGGLLVDLLVGTTSAVGLLLGGVLDTVAALTLKLEADLKVGLGAVAQVNVCGGAELNLDLATSLSLSIKGVVDVLAKFCADVNALAPQIAKNGASDAAAQALSQVLAMAEMLVRVR